MNHFALRLINHSHLVHCLLTNSLKINRIFCFLMWRHSQKDNIDASNVTGDWDEKEGAAVTSADASAEAQILATEKAGS